MNNITPVQKKVPISNFSQPTSRPPTEIDNSNLEDAFGSLMSGNNSEDKNN
jgi:hypothetical protein